MSETALKPYASAYFEYDADRRVSKSWSDGECGCSGSANGAHEFSYEAYPAVSSMTTGLAALLEPASRTIVKTPDNSRKVVTFDGTGQVLASVIADGNPVASPAPEFWSTVGVRDASGLLIEQRTPANVSSYDHSTGEFTFHASAGLIRVFERWDNSAGAMEGFLKAVKHKEGTGGTEVYESRTAYASAERGIEDADSNRYILHRPFTSSVRRYHTAGSSESSNYHETTFAYTFWTGAAELMPKVITTTNPVVSTANNGSGVATQTKRFLRPDGTTAFTQAADGILSYTQHENGRITRTVADAKSDVGTSYPNDLHPHSDFDIAQSTAGLHLQTSYTYDQMGRLATTTDPKGRVSMRYETTLADGRRVMLSIPRVEGGTYFGPVSYSVTNQAGHAEFQGGIALDAAGTTEAISDWIDTTKSDPILAFRHGLGDQGTDEGTLARMSTSLYRSTGSTLLESRTYFDIPASGEGTEGTHYDAARHRYDSAGRKDRQVDATGTIRRTVFDAIGRAVETWIGTNDNNHGALTGGTSNMTKIEEIVYDGGGIGNGLVTRRTQDADGNWGTTADQRVTEFTHNFRGFLLFQKNPEPPHMGYAQNNLGQTTAVAAYSSDANFTPGTTNPAASGPQEDRLSLQLTEHDEMGRAFKTVRFEIDQNDGDTLDSIESLKWFDPAGRLVKIQGESGLEKYEHDRLGRSTATYKLALTDDVDYDDVFSNGTVNLAGDIVLEEHRTIYEDETGLALMTYVIKRRHDDLANGTVGPLDTNADNDRMKITAADLSGEVQGIAVRFYDADYRVRKVAQYGTAGLVAGGAGSFDLGTLSEPSSSSSTVIVTRTIFDGAGQVLERIDPKGIRTRFEYDAAGRQLAVINNFDENINGGLPSGAHDNQTVRYEYTAGLQSKVIAKMPNSSDDQLTEYIYGTPKGTPGSGSPTASQIATGHLLREVIYPPGQSSDTLASRTVTRAYNALSQVVWMKDQAGNVTDTAYDARGRETIRTFSTIASSFDTRVHAVGTSYTPRGQVERKWQEDEFSTIVDDTFKVYDGWGNLVQFIQDVDSEIGANVGRDEFEVAYTYQKATPTGGRPMVRRTGMTSTAGTDITYEYLSSGNSLDDAAGRVSRVKQGIVVVAMYQYLGQSQLVGTDLPEPDYFSYRYGPTTGHYSDRNDRFWRPTEDAWQRNTGNVNNPMPKFHHITLAWDEASNITSIVDHVHVLRDGNGDLVNNLFDAKATFDPLHRLLGLEQGHLSGGSITTQTQNERWMDGSGNSWLSHTGNKLRHIASRGTFPTFSLDDTRDYSKANELLTRDIDSNSTIDYQLVYDAVGNLKDDNKDYKYTWSPQGWLTEVRNQSNAIVARYSYNAWGHRTTRRLGTADERECFLFDERWRIAGMFEYDPTVSENAWKDRPASEMFAWHAAGLRGMGSSSYIDAAILRDKFDVLDPENPELERRDYMLANWRNDTVVVVSDSGVVQEFVQYWANGVPFGIPAGNAFSNGWNTVDDLTALIDWHAASVYDARWDINADGKTDFDDYDHWPGVVMGRGVLSHVGNRIGYAGYQHAPELGGMVWHARFRWLNSLLAVWLSRDPAGDIDGPNRYQYARSRPLVGRDPMGLMTAGCVVDNCGGDPPQPPCYKCPGGVGRQGDSPTSDCDRCCTDACNQGRRNHYGVAVCCGTDATLCLCDQNQVAQKMESCFRERYERCLRAHEGQHVKDIDCSNKAPCSLTTPFTPGGLPWRDPRCGGVCSEYEAYKKERECLEAPGFCDGCPDEAACRDQLRKELEFVREQERRFRARCDECRRQDPPKPPDPPGPPGPKQPGKGSTALE